MTAAAVFVAAVALVLSLPLLGADRDSGWLGEPVTIETKGKPRVIAAGLEGVWALTSLVRASEFVELVEEIDPDTDRVVGESVVIGDQSDGLYNLAVGEGALWVTHYPLVPASQPDRRPGTVLRIDPERRKVATRIHVGHGPQAIAVGEGAVWVANEMDDTVSRIDPATSSVITTIPVGDGPSEIEVGGGSIWVTNTIRGYSVSRIDPRTSRVVATFTDVELLAVANGIGWVTANGRLRRLDIHTNEFVDPTFSLEILPITLTEGDGALWMGRWVKDPLIDYGLSIGTPALFKFDPVINYTVGEGRTLPGDSLQQPIYWDGALWVPDFHDGKVWRIPLTNRPEPNR